MKQAKNKLTNVEVEKQRFGLKFNWSIPDDIIEVCLFIGTTLSHPAPESSSHSFLFLHDAGAPGVLTFKRILRLNGVEVDNEAMRHSLFVIKSRRCAKVMNVIENVNG